MTRLRSSILFPAILIMGLLAGFGCGQSSSHSAQSPGSANTSSLQPAGLPPSGEPSENLDPNDDLGFIKTKIQNTPENLSFASSKIETAEFDSVANKPEVKVTLQGESKPVILQGDLKPSDSGFVGEFTDSSGAHPDLQVAATCKDKDCSDGDLIIQDKDGLEAGTHITHQEYTLHLIVPSDETPQEMKDAGLDSYSKDRQVDVISSSTLYGKTILSVVDTKTKKVLYVPVVKTDEDTLPTSDSAVTLYGRSPKELVFRVTKAIKNPNSKEKTAVAFWDMTKTLPPSAPSVPSPPASPAVVAQVPQECPVKLTGKVSPLVSSFLKDCTHPLVLKYVDWWTKQKPNQASLTSFLQLFRKSQASNASGQALDFQKMIKVLQFRNLPDVWSLVTLAESHFTSGYKDGIWQITPDTADALNLSLADRQNIVLATDAVAKYYNQFLVHYKNDTELALAAYNAGQCGVDTYGKGIHCKYNTLTQHAYPATVWKLCELAFSDHIKNGTCVYVPKIIAAMTVSLDPSAYGVTEVTPMEGM